MNRRGAGEIVGVGDPGFAEVIGTAVESGMLEGVPKTFAVTNLQVDLAGRGETYAVWMITNGSSTLALRLPHVPVEQMPRSLDGELSASKFIPPSVGPRPLYAVTTEQNLLGSPYMVSEYMAGEVASSRRWSNEDFSRLAQKIALLHQGALDLESVDGPEVYDLADRFGQAVGWWRANHPELMAVPRIRTLADKVTRFIEKRSWAYRKVQRSFIHGDLCATNIVFDTDSEPWLIDWEWSEIGDPAKDLAYVGGKAWAFPWYVPMSGKQVHQFVKDYADARHEISTNSNNGAIGSIPMLLARREAWEGWERFTMGLHCLKRGRDDLDAWYTQTGELMHRRLYRVVQQDSSRG